MTKRIEVTLDDERYMLIKGKWYDSHFVEAPLNLVLRLTEQILNDNSVSDFSNEDLERFVMGFKDQGLAAQALRIADVLYDRYVSAADTHKLRWLMPVETSLLRMSGVSQKAIEFYTCQTEKFGNEVTSPQLLTSIAAAYCDVGDYVKAKRLCDKAYAWSGSSYELSAVYERIKKETDKY